MLGKLSHKERRAAYLMVAPALLAVFAIIVYPLAFASYYSLRDVRANLVGEFVGLANYAAMFQDPDFVGALVTTVVFTAASAGLSFVVGLGLALFLSRPFAGRVAVATAVFLPWIFPPVVTGTLGRLALNDGGVVQGVLMTLGLGGDTPLLGNPAAMLSVAVLLDVWRASPFVALLLLAGMRTIPKEVYEAASVEGANALQRFYAITLPLLKPAILIVVLIRLLDAFRVHDLFWVMGDRRLDSLSTYVYQNVLLSQINFGLGSAAAVFTFATALLLALFFVVVLRAQVSTGLGQSGLAGDTDEIAKSHGLGRGTRPWLLAGVLVAAAFLAPLAWVLWLSVAPAADDPYAPGFLGSLLALPYALLNPEMTLGLLNSALIAGVTTALTLLLAGPAAYAIARVGFRYGNALLGVMLAVAFFPPVAVLVPLLVQLNYLGLTGTHLGAILPHTVFFTPFAVWLLATFFRDLPVEVEDAARIDGAGRLRVLTAVILPVAAPAVFATGAFVFVLSWNELVLASTFTLYPNVRPVTAVLANLVALTSAIGASAPLAAASLAATVPPIVLFLTFRRRILAGLTGDALDEGRRTGSATRNRLPRRTAFWVSVALLLAAQLWALTFFVRNGWYSLSFPFPLNYGEGPLLDQAVRLANFESIYRLDLSAAPYTISNYPPVYALLQAPFVELFGPAFWYGRGISLLGVVATALFVGLTVHALTKSHLGALAAGLTFPATFFVFFWSSYARVDFLALAFSWAGLFVVARWPERRRAVLLAALLLVLAIYTRQSYALAAPLAAFVWLITEHHRRRAFELAAVVGGVSLALLGTLTLLTGGGFFFHTVTANVNEFRWDQVGMFALRTWFTVPYLVVVGLVFLLLAPWRGVRSWWLVGPYLVGATLSALTVGKVGSGMNYLLELSAALCLATGATIAWQARRPGRQTVLVLLLALQVAMLAVALQSFNSYREEFTAPRAELQQLARIVENADGPVLADEYMGLLPTQGRRIQLQPFEMTQLAREEKWDQQPLLDEIEAREFDVIMIWEPDGSGAFPGLANERWTDEMLAEIEEHYEPTNNIADAEVYRPK